MVEAYTQKYLTYQKDLLPALSGIANRVHDLGRYFGGIWESDLLGQLAWYSSVDVNDSRVRKPKFTSRNLPSFLWGSINGPISFLDISDSRFGLVPTFSVLGIDLIPSESNSLADIEGTITVQGSCIPATLVHEFEKPMESNVFLKSGRESELCLWATLLVAGHGYHIFHPDGTGGDSLLTLASKSPVDLDLLLLGLFCSDRRDSEQCYALVLAKQPGAYRNEASHFNYYRVGMVGSIDSSCFRTAEVRTITLG